MNYWSEGIRHIQKIDPIFQNYGIKKKILNINKSAFEVLFNSICSQQISTSAAQSIPELENEIQILEKLTLEARAVRDSGEDKKWSEVRKVIIDQDILSNPTGQRRKLIIFTEHLATLKYLVKNLQTLIGKKEEMDLGRV